MTESKDKKQELKELITASFFNGSSELSTKEQTSFSGYSSNPLDLLNPKEAIKESELSLYVTRTSEIKRITEIIGSYQDIPNNIHVALVGEGGCGKHLTLKTIFTILKGNLEDFTYEFYSPVELYDYKRNKQLTKKEVRDLSTKKVNVRILSGRTSSFNELKSLIEKSLTNSTITFTVWNAYQYSNVIGDHADKTIVFTPYTNDNIFKILRNRVDHTLQERELYKEIKEAIRKISYNSKGNLQVAFSLFERAYKYGELNQKLLEQEIQYFEKIRNLKITNKELALINYALENGFEQGISSTQLVQNLNYNRVIAWTYLERLLKKKIVVIKKYGKPSIYAISHDFLMIYEGRKQQL